MVEERLGRIEESKRHYKERMTVQRAWDWDLHEMREAAMTMSDPLLHDTLGDYPAPKVAGFTPINHWAYSDSAALIDSEHDNAATKFTTADKSRAPKRRKTQPSAATTTAKSKRAAIPKKTKRAKTAAQLDCEDISQGLPITKPTSSGNRAPCAKTRLPLGGILLGPSPEPQRIGDTQGDFEVKRAPFGLAHKYQAAYPKLGVNVVNHATTPTPPKSDGVETELYHNDQSRGRDSATERQASSDTCIERPIRKNPKLDGTIIVRDFGAPPFTQMSPPTLQEPNSRELMMVDNFEPLASTPKDLSEVGSIEDGDHGGADEYPMDDECLEEMMHSMAVPAEEEAFGPDWLPHEFSDDSLYFDEQSRNDQTHWPEAIPGSDGVVIYDEGPTFLTGDIVDVPSSPSLSSQASCILTHVTGNVEPDRARTSQGSENCFDDHDLDDGLIDLMVDESKSLQVASPVTPAKQPLSPKLKWLPPKTYTPAKSSQTPLTPTNDPHLLPVKLNGDAQPFIRPPFPKAVRDRSPILGLSNRTVLRICFRIGEALNAAAVASRTNVDAIVELYARVVTSSREASGGYKQLFQFADIFTDKPPYLNGTYTFWKGVEIWDNDTKELVGDQGRGKMVRVLGRIKRKEPVQGQGPGAEMVILSIWEVDWEDVETVKGIVCPKESPGYTEEIAAGVKC